VVHTSRKAYNSSWVVRICTFSRNFEGNPRKKRKKSGECPQYGLFLQLLFLYALKDVTAALRKLDLMLYDDWHKNIVIG